MHEDDFGVLHLATKSLNHQLEGPNEIISLEQKILMGMCSIGQQLSKCSCIGNLVERIY